MKKIDITITEVDVPTNCPIVHFAVRPKMEAMILREGEVPDAAYITAERLTYEVRRVRHQLGRREAQAALEEVRKRGGLGVPNYREEEMLVKVDDQHLFDSLLKVSQDDINRLVDDKYEERVEELNRRWQNTLYENIRRTKREIRALPWLKRLFKKF